MGVHKRFGLHQVLSYRKELERLRKLDFAAAKCKLEEACECLDREKQYAAQLAKEFSAMQGQLNSVADLQMYTDFFVRKRNELKEQQVLIEELDRLLELQRQELQLATTEKKVLEQLKEKLETSFRKELAHKEALLLDEISVQKKAKE